MLKQNRTTKNWVEEELSKFPIKKEEKKKRKRKEKKKDTNRQSKCHVFVKQVVFLTVNHRGPLPLRELHSTDETLVWRDPGGSWACLRPVYHYGWNHPVRVAVTCHLHRKWWHSFSEDKAALYMECWKEQNQKEKRGRRRPTKSPEKNKKNEP